MKLDFSQVMVREYRLGLVLAGLRESGGDQALGLAAQRMSVTLNGGNVVVSLPQVCDDMDGPEVLVFGPGEWWPRLGAPEAVWDAYQGGRNRQPTLGKVLPFPRAANG